MPVRSVNSCSKPHKRKEDDQKKVLLFSCVPVKKEMMKVGDKWWKMQKNARRSDIENFCHVITVMGVGFLHSSFSFSSGSRWWKKVVEVIDGKDLLLPKISLFF